MSQHATKTLRQAPSEEVAKNAQLLIRAGFINKEMAGVYNFLPLGLRVMEKIKTIVREEMDKLGGQEIIMSTLQRPALWQKTDRWDGDKVDIWFKTKLNSGSEIGLGWSHEEPITDMMKSFVGSYRDLPKYVYQFQTKLRNELRAKNGLLRGREFVMKDLYSYSRDEKSHQEFYDAVIKAYLRVFERVGLGDKTFLTFASGGAFTQFSHEFQTVMPGGEDTIYLDREKGLAVNQEVLSDDVLQQLGLERAGLQELAAAEVGNIFNFGTAKSEQLDLLFTDEDGKRQGVVLGSYGIGITRLIGVVAELMGDDRGLVWPAAIAPYRYHLIWVGSEEVKQQAEAVYDDLTKAGHEVLFDDRDVRPGEKMADADLIGLPWRLVVSDKTQGRLEIKARTADEIKLVDANELQK